MKDSVDDLAEIFLSRFCEKVAERLENRKPEFYSDSSARDGRPHRDGDEAVSGEDMSDEEIEALADKIVEELINEGESLEELPPVAVEI